MRARNLVLGIVSPVLVVLVSLALVSGISGCTSQDSGDRSRPTPSGDGSSGDGSSAGDPVAGDPVAGDRGADGRRFVEQANRICADGNVALRTIMSDVGPASSAADLEAFVRDFVGNVRGQVDGIAALEPPAAIADDVESFLDAARAALADIEAEGASAVLGGDDPFTETRERGIALGLTDCAAA